MPGIGKVLVAVLATTALAACGTAGGNAPAGPAGAPEVRERWTSCEAEVPDRPFDTNTDVLQLPRLGADFVPVAAIVCGIESGRRPDGGQDLVAVESRADDVSALVTAVRMADERRTGDACTMDLPGVAWFALLDARGRWVHPGVPQDKCGKIRIEVRNAVAALKLTRVKSRVVGESQSGLSASSGCSDQYADMVWVEGQFQREPRQVPTGENPVVAAKQVRLCLYRVPASERGGAKPGGNLYQGGIVPASRRDQLTAALRTTLSTARPAPACTTPASAFALLESPDRTSGQVMVELDACTRILVSLASGGSALATADPALLTLLTQA